MSARPKLRVQAFGISVDGYGAGPSQSLENSLGVGGLALHDWAFATYTFQSMHGKDDLLKLGYRCTEHVPTDKATHVVLSRSR